jgi:hypothetical protein
LVAMAIAACIHLVQFCTLRRAVTTPVGLPEELNYRPKTCPPRPLLHVELPPIIARSSFTVLDWLSTSFSRIPSFWSPGVDCTGPSALLGSDSSTSCFSFSGSKGGVVLVSKSEKHHISHFTLDNSILDPAAGSSCYPKEGVLWGLFEGPLPGELRNVTTSFVTGGATYVLMGSFCLDPQLGSVQTFAVDDTIVAISTMEFSVFYLEISSNWGGTHTCVCRLRLHGRGSV